MGRCRVLARQFGAVATAAAVLAVTSPSSGQEQELPAVLKYGRFVLEAAGDVLTASTFIDWARRHLAGAPETPAEQNELGVEYLYGINGHPVDVDKAVQNFEAASNAGNLDATLNLGVMYSDGTIDKADLRYRLGFDDAARAKDLLESVADQRNDPVAEYDLGSLAETQLADSEALRWYAKAADNPRAAGAGISAQAEAARHRLCSSPPIFGKLDLNEVTAARDCTPAELREADEARRRLLAPPSQ